MPTPDASARRSIRGRFQAHRHVVRITGRQWTRGFGRELKLRGTTTQDSHPAHGTYRLAADTLGAGEIEAAKAVLDSGQLTMGRQVREFEAAFADWVGADHAVMVNSGSSANLLVVDALLRPTAGAPRLAQGDEVLVPALAWPTTVWPLVQLGLVPVFADVDPRTLAMDLGSAEAMLGERTRGMFLIHPLGRAANLREFADFSDQHGIALLEDSCESLGAHWAGAHVGTVGEAGTFSFYFSHHVSTIEGGMIVTDNSQLADDLRGLRAHGWIRDRTDRDEWTTAHPELDPRFLFATMGYNVRPTEIQGAIGAVQLQRLDAMLAARDALARRVHGWLLEAVPWLELIGADTLRDGPPSERRGRPNSWMTLPLRLRPSAPLSREGVVQHLEAAGVETRPIIAGNLAQHPAVRPVEHRAPRSMPVADSLLHDAFMIGCHPILSAESLGTLEAALKSLADL